MNDQADVRERVAAEMERFRKALPKLIEDHPDKWVIFLNGEARGFFDDQLEAYRSAVDQFGRYGGFVVARAVEERLIPLTAALMFAPR